MNYFSGSTGAARAKARLTHVSAIREEGRAAILSEQLSYLLQHSAHCSGQCPDCARLRSVERVLLQPFEVEVYSPAG